MKNEAETNPSQVTLAADSVIPQLPPAVAAVVETHHELSDIDNVVRNIQEAGVKEARAEGASVPPSTDASPDSEKQIEEKIKRAASTNLKTSNSAKWRPVTELINLAWRIKAKEGIKQPKAA